MEKNITGNDFIDTVVSKVDLLVGKFYKQNYVQKFIDFQLVGQIMKNKVFLSINSFFEKKFDIITKILGILGIIGGIISLLSIFNLLGVIVNFYVGMNFKLFYLINFIGSLITSILVFIGGIGLLKLKKWTPFIILIEFYFWIIFSIVSYILYISLINKFFATYMDHSIISMVIGTIFFIIFVCLIIKNKEKFNK